MSFNDTLHEHQKVFEELAALTPQIENITALCVNTIQKGRTLFWAGNGGSAADAQHMAAELVVRYVKNRSAIRSIALTTDTSILTACGNDLGYEHIFARQIEALAVSEDTLILLSTSGNSPNCVLGLEQADKQNVTTISITGQESSKLSEKSHYCLQVPSLTTARIQEATTLIAHYICQQVESIATKT